MVNPLSSVTRAVRVISQPRGNMLLVGVGGSGRQSLSRMAAYICEYQVFMIEVTKQYRKQEFREGEAKTILTHRHWSTTKVPTEVTTEIPSHFQTSSVCIG